MSHDNQYLAGLRDILVNGTVRHDRTGVGTISLFGSRQVYDLQQGFPALTTKKLAWKAVVSELLWFIEGSGDERRLCEILHNTRDPAKTTIWTQNANAPYWSTRAQFTGDVGRIYGVQWRDWTNPYGQEVDQLAELITGLINDPFSRRHILTAWNPGELSLMALPPCHCFSQFYVREENGQKFLDCQMYQRSNDFFLGGPFNVASYSLLTHLLALVTDLQPGKLVHVSGDAHIYSNHVDQVNEQLSREPMASPTLVVGLNINNQSPHIDGFTMSDIRLHNYASHPAIKAPMAV